MSLSLFLSLPAHISRISIGDCASEMRFKHSSELGVGEQVYRTSLIANLLTTTFRRPSWFPKKVWTDRIRWCSQKHVENYRKRRNDKWLFPPSRVFVQTQRCQFRTKRTHSPRVSQSIQLLASQSHLQKNWSKNPCWASTCQRCTLSRAPGCRQRYHESTSLDLGDRYEWRNLCQTNQGRIENRHPCFDRPLELCVGFPKAPAEIQTMLLLAPLSPTTTTSGRIIFPRPSWLRATIRDGVSEDRKSVNATCLSCVLWELRVRAILRLWDVNWIFMALELTLCKTELRSRVFTTAIESCLTIDSRIVSFPFLLRAEWTKQESDCPDIQALHAKALCPFHSADVHSLLHCMVERNDVERRCEWLCSPVPTNPLFLMHLKMHKRHCWQPQLSWHDAKVSLRLPTGWHSIDWDVFLWSWSIASRTVTSSMLNPSGGTPAGSTVERQFHCSNWN